MRGYRDHDIAVWACLRRESGVLETGGLC